MKRTKCIDIFTNEQYILISDKAVDMNETIQGCLLEPRAPKDYEYVLVSKEYFNANFRLLNTDYKKIKSPIYGNETLIKQCSAYEVPGYTLNANFAGIFNLGHGSSTFNLGVYSECEFDNNSVYTISTLDNIVVDIYE